MQSHEVLLTARELGERLAVSPSTVIQWAKDGRIPEVRPSPRIRRFDWGDVVAALSATRSNKGGRPMPTNAPDRPIDAPDRIPTGRLCYSVAEAADQIRVSPRQVYTLARRRAADRENRRAATGAPGRPGALDRRAAGGSSGRGRARGAPPERRLPCRNVNHHRAVQMARLPRRLRRRLNSWTSACGRSRVGRA